jgi:ribosomal subunit interface protein
VDVRVAGHQVDTGETLREHAASRMAEITEKYFSRSVGANVTFGRGPNNDFTCDIVAPVTQGVVLKASHRAQTAQIAFEAAADKIEKQLRRPPSPRGRGRAPRDRPQKASSSRAPHRR